MAKTKGATHKGGRSKSYGNVRCTPDALARYKEILAKTGESGGDLLERLILAEWNKQFPPDGWVIAGELDGVSPLYFMQAGYPATPNLTDAKVYSSRGRAERAINSLFNVVLSNMHVEPFYKKDITK